MNSWSCCDDYESRYPEDDRTKNIVENTVRLALIMSKAGIPQDTIVQVIEDYLTPDR